MQCPKCGYQMSAFDAVCPRCKGEGLKDTPEPTTPAQNKVMQGQPGRTPTPQSVQPASTTFNAPPQPAQPYGVPQVVDAGSPALGIISLILAILALITFWLPFIPLLVAVIAVILGFLGLKNQASTGLSIGGLAVGSVALVLSLFVSLAAGALLGVGGATLKGRQISKMAIAADTKFSNVNATITNTAGGINTVTFTGTVQNTGTISRSIPITAKLLNMSGAVVATERKYFEVPAGGNLPFTIDTFDKSRTSPFTFQVVVE